MDKRQISARKRRMIAKRCKRKAIKVGLVLVCIFAVIGIVRFNLHKYVNQFDTDKILSGISIGNLDVSGMTKKEAKAALEQKLAESDGNMLTLKAEDDRAVDVPFGELEISVRDIDAVVQEAWDYGRKGTLTKKYKAIKKLEKKNTAFPVTFQVGKKAAETVFVSRAPELVYGATNATLVHNGEGLEIVDGVNGIAIDSEASIKAINQFLNKGWKGESGAVTLVTKEEKPKVSANQLKDVKDLLGTYSTYCGEDGSGRVQNIIAASASMNGSIIMPGEEFSANASMEPYTAERGYTEAGSYEGNRVVQTMGGGICQVSTTFYNAVLLAELDVVERYPHSMLVDYVQPSMDAAIADDVMDLVIKNNLDAPVYVESKVENGNLIFNLYGKETRNGGRTIAYESETVSKTEDTSTRFFADEQQYVGYYQVVNYAYPELFARLWKVVYENGVEVSREQVNSSQYVSSPKTISVGVQTDNAQLQQAVLSAISSQNEQQILSAIQQSGGE